MLYEVATGELPFGAPNTEAGLWWGYRLMIVRDPDGNELYFPYPADGATG